MPLPVYLGLSFSLVFISSCRELVRGLWTTEMLQACAIREMVSKVALIKGTFVELLTPVFFKLGI